nr:hypothetical protein HK105_001173 [Polyrhizophydium stewartii]
MDISIRGFLENHILFKDYASNTDFIDTLANLMKTRVFSDGAFVIRKGEVGRAMFFVLRGEVEVVSEDALSIAQIAEERFSSHIKQTDSAMNVEFGEELKVGITQNDLKSIPLFRDCEVGFLHNLAMSLKPVQYTNANLIISKGEIASEMFFVVRGIAEVFNETTGQVFAQFHPGSFFGEVGLFFRIKRSASVRCNTPEVTVFKLMRTDLDSVLMNYPEVRQKIEAEAAQRFKFIESREKANLDKEHHEITDIEVIREQLKTIPIFKDTSIGFLHQLALAAKLHVYHEGKIIIRKGEIGSMMYFVIDGAVQVVSEDFRTVYAEMATNSFFGEVSLFFDVNRTATVRANCKTTLLQLSKESLHEVLMQYPAIKGPMHIKAEQNYELYRARQKTLQLVSTSAAHREQFDIETTTSRLKSVPVFNGCEEGFLRVLALSTSIRSLRQGDFIVRVGEDSCEMYFVVQGQVEIVSDDGKNVFDEVLSGGFFGEVGVIRGIKRTASVRVKSTVCDLIVLSSDAMRKALNEYPDSFQSVMLEAQKRFQLVENRTLRVEHALANVLTDSPHSGSANSHIQHTAIEAENAQEVKRSAEKERSRPFGQLFSRHSRKKPAELEPSQLKQVMTTSQDSISDPHRHPKTLIQSSTKAFINSDKLRDDVLRRLRIPPHKPITSILDANEQQLQLIFSGLSPIDILRLRGVCRRWNELLLHPHFWSKLMLRSEFRKINRKVIEVFGYLGGESLIKIDLTGCWMVFDDDIRSLVTQCTNIKALSVSNCWKLTDAALGYIAQKSSHLINLNISYCGQMTGSGFTDHVWRGLRKINLSYCKQIGDEQLEKLLSRTTELQDIKMHRRLRSLDLRDMDQISDRCLKWIASSCFNLVDLNLAFCLRITNSGLYDLSLGSQSFQRLDFSTCVQLTDASIVFFSDSIRSLRSISLRQCKNMTDGVTLYLAKTSPKLKFVDVTGCPNITSISKIQLQTYIEGVAIRIDQSPASRGIVQPCQSGRPRATEVSLREVFTSGPRDSMLAVRKTKRGLSSSVAKALRATSSPKTADPGAERARLVSPMPPPGAASNGRRSRNSWQRLAASQQAVRGWSLGKVVQPREDIFNARDPHIKQDIIRMIAQYLGDEGYNASKLTVLDEANVKTFEREENQSEIKRMRKAILEGDWAEVDKLCSRPLVRNNKSFLYAAYKQQYLEYIEHHEIQKAFTHLNKRVKPLEHLQTTPSEFKDLCYLLTAKSVHDVPSFRNWEGITPAREKLAELFQSMVDYDNGERNVYVPPNRLLKMLRQAVAYQVESSRYHPSITPKIQSQVPLLQDYASLVLPNSVKSVFVGHTNNVKCVEFVGEDGMFIMSGSSGDVYSVKYHPTNAFLATGGYDKVVRLFDVERGMVAKTFSGHQLSISKAIFSPLGNLIISGSKDNTIKFWDIISGLCIKTISSHLGEVTCVEMSSDGTLLLSSSKDNSNRLWDIRMLRPIRKFKGHQNTSKNFIRASFAGDSLIVGGSEDGAVYLWDRDKGDVLQRLRGHTGVVYSAAWNARQALFASCSEDSALCTWWYDQRASGGGEASR